MTTPGRYPIPALTELPDDIRERIETVQEKSGFIPNVFLMLAHRPDEFRAFFDYYDAVMERDGNLTKAEKEMIVVATSAANNCQYCVIAHGAILRIYAKDPFIADQIAINYRSARVSDRQHAMLEFAVRLARAPEEVGVSEREALSEHGFGEEDVWDIAAIVGLFALSNRMAHVTDMVANSEFYTLGR